MGHEPGALQSNRPTALRAAQKAGGPSGGRSRAGGGAGRVSGHPRAEGAEPRAAKRPGGPLAGRAAGDRGRVLLRIDACRSRGAAESAPRHGEDAHPFRAEEASAGAGRGRESMSRAPDDKHREQQAESLISGSTDVLSPSPSLQARLARRIASETGAEPVLQ